MDQVRAMQTKLVFARDPVIHQPAIEEAAKLIRRGGLAIIPTETVYGLAANALDDEAVAGIFDAKGRPQDNPLIVHVTSIEDMEPLVQSIPPAATLLANRFWPGPLTIILPKSAAVSPVVSGGLETVAIRMPSHPIARAVISKSGVPIAAPSANLSGTPSPTRAEHCRSLIGRVDLIVDGGECTVGLESTVVSLTGGVARLLRPGVVTLEELREVLGEVTVDRSVTRQMPPQMPVASPGMKYRHYAPQTTLTLVHSSWTEFQRLVTEHPESAAMVFDEELEQLGKRAVSYGHIAYPEEQAQQLFSALRKLDELQLPHAFVRAPQTAGVGLAVYNRLLRAAGFSELYL